MKKDTYLTILLAVSLWGCGIKYPAVPKKELDASHELAFIYKTDQKDRKRVLIKLLTKKYEDAIKDPKLIKVSDRDSLRLSRVISIYKENLVITDEDKFHAASIFDHGGGSKMHPDTAYFHIAYNLFKQLYEKGYKTSFTKSLMGTSYQRWQNELHKK